MSTRADIGEHRFGEILVVRLSALGDVVNTFPVLPLLRHRYPQARITYLTGPATAALLETDPCVDRVWVHRRSRNPFKRLAAAARLRRGRFDLVIDLQNAGYSRFLVWASGAKARIGNRPGRWYTHPVPAAREPGFACQRFVTLLRPLGIEVPAPEPRFPELEPCRDEARRVLEELGLATDGYVVLNPGHSPQWPTKRWPAAHWGALARLVRDRTGLPCLVTGAPSDEALAKAVMDAAGDAAVNLAGKTGLPALAGIMARAALVVSSDSGPMHVAAMTGTPVVALFGPTDPTRSAPYGPGDRVIHRELPCSNCFLKRCPHGHECLDDLMPDTVWHTVSERLAAAGRPDPQDTE